MNQRQLGILFAASLTVLVIAVWVAHRAQRGSASIAGTTVLPGLTAQLNAVTEVRIRGAGGKQGEREVLRLPDRQPEVVDQVEWIVIHDARLVHHL